MTAGQASRLRRAWEWVKFPPPHQGPVLDGRIDGVSYLVAWLATLVHLSLAACVLLLGLDDPWPIVSTITSVMGTLVLLTLVIVIHRRMGQRRALHKDLVWQWWLGPWDPVGRLIWLPVRLGEAWRTLFPAAP